MTSTETKQYDLGGRKIIGKVLLLEDDAILGPWLQSKLQKVGLTCTLSTTVSDAVQELEKHLYHAVITDVFMGAEPEGLKLVRAAEVYGTPTIVISSQANLSIAKEAMNHGASYLMEKPFEAEDLIKVLQKLWDEPKGLQAMVERFLDINNLTPKEKDVVRLLLKGLSNKEVASIGGNSDRTIKFHLTTIFEKCGVTSRTELFNAIFPT